MKGILDPRFSYVFSVYRVSFSPDFTWRRIQKFVEWYLGDKGDEKLNGMVWISAGLVFVNINWNELRELKMEIVKRVKFNQTSEIYHRNIIA